MNSTIAIAAGLLILDWITPFVPIGSCILFTASLVPRVRHWLIALLERGET